MPRVSSYTSPDEARSDLFLSGAAYVFGGTLVAILFSVTRLDRVAGVGTALAIVLPILTTILVPVLLMRYRGESLRDLGLGGGGDGSVVPGLLVGLPIVAASVVAPLLAGGSPADGLPILQLGGARSGLLLVIGIVQWCGVLFLALYGTVKARDAFRGETQPLEGAVTRVGRIVAIIAGVSLVMLILAVLGDLQGMDSLALIVLPLGVAAAVLLALRITSGPTSTTLPTVLTPVVLLALGPFAITLNVTAITIVLYQVALYSGIGLIVAVLVERTQRGAGVLALALVLALGTQVAGAASLAL